MPSTSSLHKPPGDEISPGPRSEERQRAVPTDPHTHRPPGATRGSSVNKTKEPQPTSRSGLTQEQNGLLSEEPTVTQPLESPDFLPAFPVLHPDGLRTAWPWKHSLSQNFILRSYDHP